MKGKDVRGGRGICQISPMERRNSVSYLSKPDEA
jgi:hypothetical protein